MDALPKGAWIRRRSSSARAVFLAAALSTLPSCRFGSSIPVDLSGPPRATAVELTDSLVEGDAWDVSVWCAGEGAPPRMTLDGRPVRGCRRVGDAAVCRFEGLRQGAHRLEVDGLARPLWARVGPWDWRDSVVYLVIPDRFVDGDPTNNGGAEYDPRSALARHGGDFAGLRQGIPHLRDLGVNVLWMTPAVRNVVEGVPHEDSGGAMHRGFHGYWPERLEEVDPHLGSEAELRSLSSDLEQAGVRTLMDVVINHLGYGAKPDADIVRPCASEAAGPIASCLHGLPDLRTELPSVADRVLRATQAWVEPHRGAHAVRLDAAKHVTKDLLLRLSKGVRGARSGALVVGEVWGASPVDPSSDAWFEEAGVDALLDFGFAGHALDFVAGRGRAEALAAHLAERHRSEGLWLHFLATHDTPPAQDRAGSAARFRLAVSLQMTTRGLPVIFSGDEVGRLAGDWPYNRPDFPPPGVWDRRTLSHYRALVALRRLHPSLTRGEHRNLLARGDLLVFLRWWEDAQGSVADAAVVAVNRGSAPQRVDLPFPPELSGASPLRGVTASGGRMRFEAPAMDAIVLVTGP